MVFISLVKEKSLTPEVKTTASGKPVKSGGKEKVVTGSVKKRKTIDDSAKKTVSPALKGKSKTPIPKS